MVTNLAASPMSAFHPFLPSAASIPTFVGQVGTQLRLKRSESMGDDKVYDEATEVTAHEGQVILDGPDGVDVKVTPEAAEQTATNLEQAAVEARGQRRFARLTHRPQ